MRTLTIVQARAGSSRLPGKVLMPLAGRSMLGFMLARLQAVPTDDLVVATSTERRDDPVAEVATAAGVAVVRGPESDVLARFVVALDAYGADVVVRLTADCPFTDPALVDQALGARRVSGADYASNTLVRTYPDGLDVEVVRASALRAAAAEANDPIEREHVTPFVYRRPERFRLAAMVSPEVLGHERWTVDTAQDLDRIRVIAAALPDPVAAGWREILAVAGRHRMPHAGGLTLRPACAHDDVLFAPPVPFGACLHGPAVRSWVAETPERPVGWAQVSVRAGAGRLSHWIERSYEGALLELVGLALSADFQVGELRHEETTTQGSGNG